MRKARGFTLIELVVVIAIVGILIAMAALATRAITAQQRRSTTASRIAAIDTALVQYVMVQKRLPCPADGSIASGVAGAGTEGARDTTTGCTGNEANGVVPWVVLGLTEGDITDGWERRMTYRVFPLLASDNPSGAMSMSFCDPAGTELGTSVNGTCDTACTAAALGSCTTPQNFLASKGLTVKNLAGTVIMDPAATPPTGAAYVVISAGESGGGAMLNTGQVATSTTTDGTEEAKNYANVAYAVGSYYVDDGLSDAAGTTHFDDIVSRPTLLTVINKAALGPRSH
jgi:prepilin-type N-terminal cleavage/methylation domain-containing protein